MSENPNTVLTIKQVAQSRNLLVVSDFDGTIAGFSKDPYQVPIHQKSLKAIKDLSRMANTDVVILSGRHLEGLAQVLDLGSYDITTVGSHGSEDSSRPRTLTPKEEAELDRIHTELERVIDRVEGAYVEVKPFHRVLHYIRVSDPDLIKGIEARAVDIDTGDLQVTHGKNIIEYSVSKTTKGTWLREYLHRHEPTGVIFIGDDTTDEHGFEVMVEDPNALSIKVGPGDTAAKMRVRDVDDVGTLLEELAYERMQYTESQALGL
ncbi:trehalose-phosphatase [uncultured Corynebacterium sp.]|uniref:trehalose-phosphatase n=1 Tax=uncultured Corynebacterium sp. TaxID=159447 RepID=UPI0025E3B542|nr:trehalose-phosphatase [uncultured Corynebacterium sp.]